MWTLAEFLRQAYHDPRLLERGWRVRLSAGSYGSGYPDIIMTRDRWVVMIPEAWLQSMICVWDYREGISAADVDLRFLEHRVRPVPDTGWLALQSQGENQKARPIKLDPQRFNPGDGDSFFVHHPVTGELVAVQISDPSNPEVTLRVPNAVVDDISRAWQLNGGRA